MAENESGPSIPTSDPSGPAEPGTSRNPWRTATLAIIAVLLLSGVAAGAFLLGRGSQVDSGSTVPARPPLTTSATVPRPTSQVGSIADLNEPSDGMLSQSEYELNQQAMIAMQMPATYLSLTLPQLQELGGLLCAQAQLTGSSQLAVENLKASFRNGAPRASEQELSWFAMAAGLAATSMCFDTLDAGMNGGA